MRINVNSEGNIRLEKIYNPIELVAGNEIFTVCERDGSFEIICSQASDAASKDECVEITAPSS